MRLLGREIFHAWFRIPFHKESPGLAYAAGQYSGGDYYEICEHCFRERTLLGIPYYSPIDEGSWPQKFKEWLNLNWGRIEPYLPVGVKAHLITLGLASVLYRHR